MNFMLLVNKTSRLKDFIQKRKWNQTLTFGAGFPANYIHGSFDHKEYGVNFFFTNWSMFFFIKMDLKQTQRPQRFNSCFANRHDKNVMHWWISTVYSLIITDNRRLKKQSQLILILFRQDLLICQCAMKFMEIGSKIFLSHYASFKYSW